MTVSNESERSKKVTIVSTQNIGKEVDARGCPRRVNAKKPTVYRFISPDESVCPSHLTNGTAGIESKPLPFLQMDCS